LEAIKNHLTRSPYIQQVFRPEPVLALFDAPELNSTRIFLLLTMDLWYNLVAKNPLEPVTKAPSLSEYLDG